jgi:hypothetical protein
MSSASEKSVQFGCGMRPGPSWVNYDVSPTLRLSKIPGLKKLLRLPDWPANVLHGDITQGLPIESGSCSRLYCDQVLEHLAREDVFAALKECRRLLSPEGVFRLFVPDLKAIATSYVQGGESISAEWFMETIGLGFTSRPRTLGQRLREYMGNSRHLWAWDTQSLINALNIAGFSKVRQVQYRDSGDPLFDELEGPIHWGLALGLEARC